VGPVLFEFCALFAVKKVFSSVKSAIGGPAPDTRFPLISRTAEFHHGVQEFTEAMRGQPETGVEEDR
jgi:hypothetical protein